MKLVRFNSEPMLTILGDVCVDHVLGPVDGWPTMGTEVFAPRSEMRAGGSGGNTALAMRHLGYPCRLVAQIGDDFFGQWLIGQLDGLGGGLSTLRSSTSVSVCVVHSHGERSIFTTEGHLAHASISDPAAMLEPAHPGSILLLSGAFVMPGVSADYDRIIATGRSLGYSIAIDTGWPPDGWTTAVRERVLGWLGECDHILLNELEVISLAGAETLAEAVDWLSALIGPAATLVVKRGAQGAEGVEAGRRQAASAPTVDVFDTVGAGDTFNAGYLGARLRRQPLGAALAAGCAAASNIIARFPRGSIPAGAFSNFRVGE